MPHDAAGGGYEDRTRDPLLAGQVLIPAELIPHIKQKTSYTHYLLIAETLLSWSAIASLTTS